VRRFDEGYSSNPALCLPSTNIKKFMYTGCSTLGVVPGVFETKPIVTRHHIIVGKNQFSSSGLPSSRSEESLHHSLRHPTLKRIHGENWASDMTKSVLSSLYQQLPVDCFLLNFSSTSICVFYHQVC
jgi:hypothetical protein